MALQSEIDEPAQQVSSQTANTGATTDHLVLTIASLLIGAFLIEIIRRLLGSAIPEYISELSSLVAIALLLAPALYLLSRKETSVFVKWATVLAVVFALLSQLMNVFERLSFLDSWPIVSGRSEWHSITRTLFQILGLETLLGTFYFVLLNSMRSKAALVLRGEELARAVTEHRRTEDALRESEERFRRSMEATNDGLWDWDIQTDHGYFSPAYYRMLGYDVGAFASDGAIWKTLIHPDDRADALRANMDCIEGRRESFESEYRMKTKDGRWRWILGRGKCVARDERGRALRLVGTHVDITERKRTEEALRESSELFAVFMRHSPIFAYIKSVTPTESRVLQASDNFEQMIGVSAADMLGKTMTELFPPALAAKITRDDWSVIDSGEVLKVDEEMNGRNYTSIKFPIRQGGRALLAGYTIDISERKRAEDALRESERFSKEIQRIGRLGGWKANPHTDYLEWTDGVYEIVEAPRDYAPGLREGMRYYLDEYIPVLRKNVEGCLATGAPFNFECQVVTESGKRLWTEVRGLAPVTKGERTYVMGTFQDITERKQAELEKEKLEAQLRQSQKLEAVGQLAGGVAHDFNNLLQVILGYTALMKSRRGADSTDAEELEQIRKAAERAADLTRQLLAFSRRQIIQPVNIDLNDLVEDSLKMIRRVIGEHIDLHFTASERLDTVHVDKGQIEQVLMNLCVNARDAMPKGGSLSIETKNIAVDEVKRSEYLWTAEGRYVLLSVTDTGHGMDEATRAQIFEPFFTTKGVGEGTGLGLATVYGIVRQHNGMIDVVSEPGRGTTFKLYIPSVEHSRVNVEKERVDTPIVGGSETVLIAEDEDGVRNLIRIQLAAAGYTVLAARDGEEALRIFDEHAGAIDLAVLDVVMPKCGGREVMDYIQSKSPRTRYLFSSGYSESAIDTGFVINEGLRLIMKPYTRAVLLSAVREVLDAPPKS